MSRKTRLAHNLETMRKGFKDEYDFFPKTYIIPRDMAMIKQEAFGYFGRSKHALIVKPDGGSQGRGIFLTKSFRDIKELKTTHVAQHYISDPFLIEGKKFDLRVYVLITSCSPLHVYLFQDGLIRMCTEDFSQPNSTNMDHKFMHLTNFAINKNSDHFVGNNDESGSSGSKRSIKWFLSWLSDEKGSVIAEELWEEIGHICSKTILSIAPVLEKEYQSVFGTAINNLAPDSSESLDDTENGGLYRDSSTSCPTKSSSGGKVDHQNSIGDNGEDSKNNNTAKAVMIDSTSRCFTVLGLDIMIDSSMKPYLIEVNELPSFASGSPLDESIKSKVCIQALSTIQCSPSDQRNYEAVVARKRMMERYRRFGNRSSIDPGTSSEEQQQVSKKKAAIMEHDLKSSIKKIYEKCAPEKLNQVDALFEKYQGHEKLLLRRVKDKYKYNESSSNSQNDVVELNSVNNDQTSYAGYFPEYFEFLQEYQLLVEHGDFDRIYPPCGERRQQLWATYNEMEHYAKEHFEQEQKRIVLPLWLQRKDGKNTDVKVNNTSEQKVEKCSSSSSKNKCSDYQKGSTSDEQQDASRKRPSKKQSEASERLTRGLSVDENRLTIGDARAMSTHVRKRKESHGNQKITLKLRPINLEFAKDVRDMKKSMISTESKE